MVTTPYCISGKLDHNYNRDYYLMLAENKNLVNQIKEYMKNNQSDVIFLEGIE